MALKFGGLNQLGFIFESKCFIDETCFSPYPCRMWCGDRARLGLKAQAILAGAVWVCCSAPRPEVAQGKSVLRHGHPLGTASSITSTSAGSGAWLARLGVGPGDPGSPQSLFSRVIDSRASADQSVFTIQSAAQYLQVL